MRVLRTTAEHSAEIMVSIWRKCVYFERNREKQRQRMKNREGKQFQDGKNAAFLISRTVGVLLILNASNARDYLLDVQP